MPAKNGKQYREAIDRVQTNVWIGGERVTGKLSKHPAFRGLIRTQAALYDMQLKKPWKEHMTYRSPSTGQPVGLSFLRPETKEDLERRREMMRLWAAEHNGMLGRSPDYMNTAIMAIGAAADLFGEQDPQLADNARSYYEYCRDNDITLSHAFLQPPSARSVSPCPDAGRIVRKTGDGIVVDGAFLLATQGATADEILVFPGPFPKTADEDNPYVFAFAVPVSLPGIRFLCRESLCFGSSSYNYPLSSRYEESDAMVVFDRVTVPWERVFLHGREELAGRFFEESHFYPHVTHHLLCRHIAKTEFFVGVTGTLVEMSGIGVHAHVVEKVAELLVVLETLKSFLVASEHGAALDRWGSMLPYPDPLLAANCYFPKLYPRMAEIVQLLGASGIMMIPGEADFRSEAADDLRRYLKNDGTEAYERVKLFRLAWELSASAFAGRQLLYERFFFGDSARVSSRLYHWHSEKAWCMKRVADFLDRV